MAVPADLAIDGIVAVQPDHTPATRPIHAPGIGTRGLFRPSEVAASFTDAAHFSGPPVDVTVRFSNGTGSSSVPDSDRLVRGMALRFHLDDPGPTDMICMTLPVFFTPTVETFMDFLDAVRPDPVPKKTLWQKAWDAVRLLPQPTSPLQPGDPGAIAYADRNPHARRAVAGLTALSVPESYVTAVYHAVHAFVLTTAETSTPVRFRWEPVAGVRTVAPNPPANYLGDELARRLAVGPAHFVLRMQVAEQGDDTADPTMPWPETRRKVVMGQLRIDALVDDQGADNEWMAFDPMRLVPGMEPSDDPILRARHGVYRRSFDRRVAEAKPRS